MSTQNLPLDLLDSARANAAKPPDTSIRPRAKATGSPSASPSLQRSSLRQLQAVFDLDVETLSLSNCEEAFSDLRIIRSMISAIEAKLTARVTTLAKEGNSRDVVSVLVTSAGLTSRESREQERRTETLTSVPVFSEALTAGVITAAHVDAVTAATANLEDDAKQKFMRRQAELLKAAEKLTPDKFRRRCHNTARELEEQAGEEAEQRRQRKAYVTCELNPGSGLYEGRFALPPEEGHRFKRRLDAEVAALLLSPASHDTNRQRLAAQALINLTSNPGKPNQAETDIVIVVGPEGLVTSDNAPLSLEALERLSCNATLTAVFLDEHRVPIDVGRRSRKATTPQRRALRTIYPSCMIPTCDVTFDQCEIHHLIEWHDGGQSDLNNLGPLCRRHHHQSHRYGWTWEMMAGREVTVTTPSGIKTICPIQIDEMQLGDGQTTASNAAKNSRPAEASHFQRVGPPNTVEWSKDPRADGQPRLGLQFKGEAKAHPSRTNEGQTQPGVQPKGEAKAHPSRTNEGQTQPGVQPKGEARGSPVHKTTDQRARPPPMP